MTAQAFWYCNNSDCTYTANTNPRGCICPDCCSTVSPSLIRCPIKGERLHPKAQEQEASISAAEAEIAAACAAVLIAKAAAYRAENPQCPSGVVVLFRGKVAGWMNELRDPCNWEPGCIAVLPDNDMYASAGGNPKDGAERWDFLWSAA